MGYVLFSGCVTGIAGDQFRGKSPVSGPDGGKEHRAAQLYGGAAWEMCSKGLVEAVCTGACAPAVFLLRVWSGGRADRARSSAGLRIGTEVPAAKAL